LNAVIAVPIVLASGRYAHNVAYLLMQRRKTHGEPSLLPIRAECSGKKPAATFPEDTDRVCISCLNDYWLPAIKAEKLVVEKKLLLNLPSSTR
jgi:hypothetical protein